MIRPITCLCMVMSGAVGLYLYQVKHQAHVLDRQIEHTLDEAKASRERTRMLSAEWTLLNEPGRLQTLAEHYLRLESMKPGQFVQLSSLGDHLPAIAAPARPPEQVATQSTDEDGQSDGAPNDSTPNDGGEGAVMSNAAPSGAEAAPEASANAPLPLVAIVHVKHAAPQAVAPRIAVLATTHHRETVTAQSHVLVPVTAQILTVRHDTRRVPATVARAIMTPKATIIAKPLPLAAPRRADRGLFSTQNVPIQAPVPSYVMHTTAMVSSAPMRAMQTASFSRPTYSSTTYSSALGMSGSALPPPVPVSTMR